MEGIELIELVDDIEEEWRAIPGFEMYLVSNYGRVYTKHRNKLLSPADNGRGYKMVSISKNNIAKLHLVHRLVAMLFIPNPLNLPEVNHKEGLKYKNRVFDLEWMTKSENMQHAVDNKLLLPHWKGVFGKNHHNSIKVDQFSKSGELIATYDCGKEAERKTGILQSNTSSCCTGKLKSAGGFIWKHSVIK